MNRQLSGRPQNEMRRNRFLDESDNFRRTWAEAIGHDPFYNPNLSNSGGTFALAIPRRVVKPWFGSA